MHGTPRTTATLALFALVFHGFLPVLAADTATIEGTVQIPCDPSLVANVVSIYVRPVSGGSVTMIPVDASTGTFRSPELTEGEYELLALGADGQPLTPESKKLLLAPGVNEIVLSLEPPGCGQQTEDAIGSSEQKPFKSKQGLKDWQLTLIYVGVVAGVVFVLSDDDDEETASPFEP